VQRTKCCVFYFLFSLYRKRRACTERVSCWNVGHVHPHDLQFELQPIHA
jgi:hypothetical protein